MKSWANPVVVRIVIVVVVHTAAIHVVHVVVVVLARRAKPKKDVQESEQTRDPHSITQRLYFKPPHKLLATYVAKILNRFGTAAQIYL